MEANWSKLIERYLQGELSADGLEAFEFELALNPDLRAELDLHKMIHESLFRSAERLAIQNIGSTYHFRAKLKKWLTFTSIVAATAVTIALVVMNGKDSNEENAQKATTEFFATEQMTDSMAVVSSNNEQTTIQDLDNGEITSTESPRNVNRVRSFNPMNRNLPLDNSEHSNLNTEVDVPVNESSNEIPKEKPKENPRELEKKAPQIVEDRKMRFLMAKGVLNPTAITVEELENRIPVGDHWTLGNFKIYSSPEGIIFYNYLTDDVIVLGKTPEDQIKELTERNKPDKVTPDVETP